MNQLGILLRCWVVLLLMEGYNIRASPDYKVCILLRKMRGYASIEILQSDQSDHMAFLYEISLLFPIVMFNIAVVSFTLL